MKDLIIKLAVSTLFMFIASTQANAIVKTTAFQSIDRGTYDYFGNHNPLNTQGNINDYSTRNFFVFDLSGIDLSKVLSVEFTAAANDTFFSYTETDSNVYTAFDVTTSVAALVADGKGNVDIYDDLGNGVVYGEVDAEPLVSVGEQFAFTFNQAGLNAVKNSNGIFAFGGMITSSYDQQATLFNGMRESYLVVTYISPVPEADNYAMLLAGIGLLGFSVYRRRY